MRLRVKTLVIKEKQRSKDLFGQIDENRQWRIIAL